MAVTESTESTQSTEPAGNDDAGTTAGATGAAAVAGSPSTSLTVAALGLWGVVGTLLGYGILQTVLKASALFG